MPPHNDAGQRESRVINLTRVAQVVKQWVGENG